MKKPSLCHVFMMLALAAPLAAGCTVDTTDGGVVDGPISDNYMSFEEFEATVYQEPDTGLYIIDGDQPVLNIDELREIYDQYVQQQGALTINVVNNVHDKWDTNEKHNITYCVSDLFGTNKSAVVTALNQAASAWEAAADVDFIYVPSEDDTCAANVGNVVFNVIPVTGATYRARSFFPSSPMALRSIKINSTAFGSIAPKTLAGIMRHELGHTLGFRHEHIRLGPLNPCQAESSSWDAVTGYDSASVMHYSQCNGTNTGDYVLTALDQVGVAAIYGLP